MLFALVTVAWFFVAKYAGLAGPHRFLIRLQHMAEQQPDLLIFGDSTFFWCGEEEAPCVPMQEALEGAWPDLRVRTLSKAAMDMELALASWRYLHARGIAPRVVVLEVNLHTFSEAWMTRPDSEHDLLHYQMRWDSTAGRALYRPLRVFQVIPQGTSDPAAYEASLRAQVRAAPPEVVPLLSRHDGTPKVLDMAFGSHYYLGYGRVIASDHPLLLAMAELVSSLRAEGVAVLVYCTPIDLQWAGVGGSGAMAEVAEQNVQAVRSALDGAVERDPGCIFYDGTRLLPSDAFIHAPGQPTEHMTRRGRDQLLAELNRRLDRLLNAPKQGFQVL